jgi:hypothetical protein
VLKQLGGKGEIAIGDVGDTVASLFKLTRLDQGFSALPRRRDGAQRGFGPMSRRWNSAQSN